MEWLVGSLQLSDLLVLYVYLAAVHLTSLDAKLLMQHIAVPDIVSAMPCRDIFSLTESFLLCGSPS